MQSVVELLTSFVRFPTQQGGGDELALCEHIAPLLRARGADEVVVEATPRSDGTPGAFVFARWGTPKRVINAHIDTVPANAGWSRDPWTPAVVGDRLYGLGSADTKGAIAATLVALEALGDRPRDVGVLFSGDEEAGSAVMFAFLKSPHARGIEQVIVCEPTARRAGVAHRGVLCQRALIEGEGGHSSKADYMHRPIAQLARFAVGLDDLGRARLSDGPAGMQGLCLNLASLSGGVAFNVVPQRAELEWSLRPYPGFDRAEWDRQVAGIPKDQAIQVADTIDHAPFACDALADEVRPFVAAIGGLDFWTEAAILQQHGIDAIVVGPGDIAQAHAADEWVPIEDLEWAAEMYRALLRR